MTQTAHGITCINAKHVQQTKVSPSGKLTKSEKTQLTIINMFKLVKTNNACFMLSFNKPDERKYSINDVMINLIKNYMLSDIKFEFALKNSILFLSEYSVVKLQKHIHDSFPDLQFVLVRLNRHDIPKLKYNKTK